MLLTIIVAVVISIIGYSKYKKTKSDDEEQDNTDDLTYNYMYQNPPKVSDLQLEHSISDARTPESREELTTGIEQKSTMSYEESEMSLFPNAAYTKKAFNKAIAATNVLYECIDKSVQTPLQINNDDEYEYV